MAGASRTLTIKFVGDSKNANRAVKDLVSSMDDAESTGKKVARAMQILSDDAEAAFRDAKDAADKLATALGDDTVAEIKAAGRSVEGYVGDLQRMGLSFDDVRLDVDALAESIRKVEATKAALDAPKVATANLGDEARIAAGKVDGLRDNSDQARGVLGSMVGGSAADLLGLGGIAGTAASAIDQMASYAVEGGLNLSDMAKLVGPLAGLGLVTMGITAAMGAQQAAAEKLRKETEMLVEVEQARADGDTETVIDTLAEAYRDTLPILEEYGLGVKEIDEVLGGNTETIEELRAKLKDYDRQLLNTKGMTIDEIYALDDKRAALDAVIGTLERADTAQGDAREQMEKSEAATAAWTEYLTTETTPALRDLEAAYKQLTGQLSNEEAWINLRESMIGFTADMASGELSVLEQRQALVDVKSSLIDYLTSLDGVPTSMQTEILADINDGEVAEAERKLNILARARGVQVYIAGGMGAGIKYSAAGNPLAAGEPSVVGDNPNGTWNSTTELFVPSVSGRILSAADSRAAVAGMGGGGTVVNVNVSPTPLASPADIGRAVREALLADARTSGPVFQTVRR
jgi:hypothetical protein